MRKTALEISLPLLTIFVSVFDSCMQILAKSPYLGSANCRSLPYVRNYAQNEFSFVKYTGEWYADTELDSTFTTFKFRDEQHKCMKVTISPESETSLLFDLTYEKPISDKISGKVWRDANFNNTAGERLSAQNKSGCCLHGYAAINTNPTQLNYFHEVILSTDYTSYSVRYACNENAEDSFLILSRNVAGVDNGLRDYWIQFIQRSFSWMNSTTHYSNNTACG